MSKKKYDVGELNKKENKILLEKKQNVFILFLKKMGPLFSILLLTFKPPKSFKNLYLS